jgi:glycerate 2-kinase
VIQSEIVGDASTAARAAVEAAARLGYEPHLLGTAFAGEAREFGRFWAQLACAASDGYSEIHAPACIIGAGEMTVVVRGDGVGGRNTEMAAAAAFELSGHDGVAVASLATDGDDGISEAAGGVVVGDTISLLTANRLNPEDFLARNDTRDFLAASGGLIVTGQTGTNVNDLYLALINETNLSSPRTPGEIPPA